MFERNSVRVEFYLPGGLIDELCCGFIFLKPEGDSITVSCTTEDLRKLLEAIEVIDSGKEIVDKGNWQLMYTRDMGSIWCTVRKNGVQFPVTKRSFFDFIEAAKELADIKEVRQILSTIP